MSRIKCRFFLSDIDFFSEVQYLIVISFPRKKGADPAVKFGRFGAKGRPADDARVRAVMDERKSRQERAAGLYKLVEDELGKKGIPLTAEETAQLRETWGWLYDEGIVRPEWYSLFKAVTGEFHPDYIGNDLHLYYVEEKLVDKGYIRGLCDKNIMPLLLPWAKHPRTLVRRLNGKYLDENFNRITESDAVRILRANRHEGAVIKLCRSSGGKGVTFVSEETTPDEIRKALRESYYITVQAVVRQHPEMAKMNPTSVNTIRVMTIMIGGMPQVVSAVVRIGGLNSRVDNFHSGGMSCGIRPDGSLKDFACNMVGDRFTVHPNGFVFAEGKVPNFDLICETVKRMHNCLPMFGVISWDICLDEACEPVLIEYNIGGSVTVHQLSNGPLYGEYRQQIVDEIFRDYHIPGATQDFNYELWRDHAEITKTGLEMDELTIPAEIEGRPVRCIRHDVFKNHERLAGVEIAAALDRIETLAFYNDRKLRRLSITGSVRQFDRSAFNNCTHLKRVSIPEGTEVIEIRAFAFCPKLKEISLPDSLKEMAPDALEGSKKAVVVCSPGSYAEAYAKENNIPYRTR